MKYENLKLRQTEKNILFHLLKSHTQSGDYFGRKDQHYKMCKELLEKLDSLFLEHQKESNNQPTT